MTGSELAFYAFAAMAVVSALACISRKNPVVAAVWLIGTFLAVAGCYVMLHATFLAAIQVLVYAGAIMVLFVFVIMVLDVDESGRVEHRRPSRVAKIGYYGSILIAGGFLGWVLLGTIARQFVTPGAEIPAGADFGTAESLGRVLFRDYLFAFEAISLMLLAAVIGAVVVARSRREREKEARLAGMHGEALVHAGLGDDHGPQALGDHGPQALGDHGPQALGEVGDIAPPGPTPTTDFGVPSATGHHGGGT